MGGVKTDPVSMAQQPDSTDERLNDDSLMRWTVRAAPGGAQLLRISGNSQHLVGVGYL
jgi:hypothetical protein